MEKSILIVPCFLLVIASIGNDANADIFNFTIKGEYKGSDSTLDIAEMAACTMTGSYDTSSQPKVLYGNSSNKPIDDVSLDYRPAYDAYLIQDYSSLLSLNYDLLNKISETYNTTIQPFGQDDIADGSYQLSQSFGGVYGSLLGQPNLWGVSDTDSYYTFSVSYLHDYSYGSGLIKYNYRKVIEDGGGGTTIERWMNDTLEFTVTDIDTVPVPEPTTMILFGAGLAGLAAARRRKKAC